MLLVYLYCAERTELCLVCEKGCLKDRCYVFVMSIFPLLKGQVINFATTPRNCLANTYTVTSIFHERMVWRENRYYSSCGIPEWFGIIPLTTPTSCSKDSFDYSMTDDDSWSRKNLEDRQALIVEKIGLFARDRAWTSCHRNVDNLYMTEFEFWDRFAAARLGQK